MKDLYKILGINKTAKMPEIKKAYFNMAKKYHPDTGSEEEVKKFYEITEAYKILSDKEQRRAYNLSYASDQIERPLVDEVIHESDEVKKREEEDPDFAFRQKEMHRFRRGLLIKAYIRVVFFTVLIGIAGILYSIILGESRILGALFASILGLLWSLFKYFDVDSFVKDKKTQNFLRNARTVIIAIAILYFVVAPIV